MKIPTSPHFTPIPLTEAYTIDHQALTGGLEAPAGIGELTGQRTFCGIPFALGGPREKNAILLEDKTVAIDLNEQRATYLLFLHVVEDRVSNYQPELADFAIDGNELGDLVADYTLEYADGSEEAAPILRRFAIQQSRIGWGASAFAAIPALDPVAFSATTDEQIAHGTTSSLYGRGETRTASGRERPGDLLWIYALPNPYPERPIRRILCVPQKERAVIYAITATELIEHPLRPGIRRKARLPLPASVQPNKIGEVDGLQIDLGTVISARAALDYDETEWLGDAPLVQPNPSASAVVVEYVAHPQAMLYVPTGTEEYIRYALADLTGAGPTGADPTGADPTENHSAASALIEIAPAHLPVNVRVVDQRSGQPAAVRIHCHGVHGEYLPPRGNHRRVNPHWFEDNYGEFVNGENQYAYINGETIIDLPLGDV